MYTYFFGLKFIISLPLIDGFKWLCSDHITYEVDDVNVPESLSSYKHTEGL